MPNNTRISLLFLLVFLGLPCRADATSAEELGAAISQYVEISRVVSVLRERRCAKQFSDTTDSRASAIESALAPFNDKTKSEFKSAINAASARAKEARGNEVLMGEIAKMEIKFGGADQACSAARAHFDKLNLEAKINAQRITSDWLTQYPERAARVSSGNIFDQAQRRRAEGGKNWYLKDRPEPTAADRENATKFSVCILEGMPDINNDVAAHALRQRCAEQFGTSNDELSPVQSVVQVFGEYVSDSECTVAKAGKTTSQVAAGNIRAACAHLYGARNSK